MAPNVVASVGSTPNSIVTINRVTANASNNLDAGAELNAQDETGKTALDAVQVYAPSSEQHRKVAAFLVGRGARSGKEMSNVPLP